MTENYLNIKNYYGPGFGRQLFYNVRCSIVLLGTVYFLLLKFLLKQKIERIHFFLKGRQVFQISHMFKTSIAVSSLRTSRPKLPPCYVKKKRLKNFFLTFTPNKKYLNVATGIQLTNSLM